MLDVGRVTVGAVYESNMPIESYIESGHVSHPITPIPDSLNDSQEKPSFQAAMKAIIARKKKTSKTQNSSTSYAEKVAKMIDDYLEKPLMSQSDNLLDFWREFSNGDRFQKAFSQVAKRYLTPLNHIWFQKKVPISCCIYHS